MAKNHERSTHEHKPQSQDQPSEQSSDEFAAAATQENPNMETTQTPQTPQTPQSQPESQGNGQLQSLGIDERYRKIAIDDVGSMFAFGNLTKQGVTANRIDFIRAAWANHKSRGDIARELTRLAGKKIPYQIVFAATKGIAGGPAGALQAPQALQATQAPQTPQAPTQQSDPTT